MNKFVEFVTPSVKEALLFSGAARYASDVEENVKAYTNWNAKLPDPWTASGWIAEDLPFALEAAQRVVENDPNFGDYDPRTVARRLIEGLGVTYEEIETLASACYMYAIEVAVKARFRKAI